MIILCSESTFQMLNRFLRAAGAHQVSAIFWSLAYQLGF